MKLTTCENPFAYQKIKRVRTRTWNNRISNVLDEFLNADVACQHVSHDEYYRANACLWSLTRGIQCAGLEGQVEAHIKEGKVYLVRSSDVDHSRISKKSHLYQK